MGVNNRDECQNAEICSRCEGRGCLCAKSEHGRFDPNWRCVLNQNRFYEIEGSD
jgi:hypothetical protein